MASQHSRKLKEVPKLRALPGGKTPINPPALERLFSSSVGPAGAKKKHGRKQEIPPIEFPKELTKYSDLFAAGKNLLREIEFKVKFAEQRLREFCGANYTKLFASLKRRPPSLDYRGENSSFKYVQTHRTTLTHEKVEALKESGIEVDDYTTLTGIDINMAAIRQHKLELKLQEGLASLGISPGIVEECFTPRHELNPVFYDNLYTIAQHSLKKGETIEEKLGRIFEILEPSSQIRNVETKLPEHRALDFVLKAEIEVDELKEN